jgi:predicted acylesterase/phospholipase RssA
MASSTSSDHSTSAPGPIATRASILEGLARRWLVVRQLWRVLMLVRFSVLLAVACTLLLLFNDQAQDALRALGEEPDGRLAWFLVAALACALVAWYAARVMLYFRFVDDPVSDAAVLPGVKAYLPRVLGGAALLFMGLAIIKSSFAYDGWRGPVLWLWGIGIALILLAGLFVYLTAKRRQWFKPGARPKDLERLRDLPWQAWVPLAGAMAAGFALMLLFAYLAVDFAHHLGTATIGLLAAAAMIPTGSLLVWWGSRYSLPVLTLILLWMVINTSWIVDNHKVRLHQDMASYRSEPPVEGASEQGRPSLAQHIEGWLAARETEGRDELPVILVAAEGGGVRAAYWTALVLSELHDRHPEFARHVLAISGVSGGSLGGAVFASLLAEPAAADQTASLRERASAILERDFLSPTVAVFLFPDLFQQLLPIAFVNDRAVALEQAWERSWQEAMGTPRFAEPFARLWDEGNRHDLPLLFLNSTVVETGQRLITAPVAIEPGVFSDALDGGAALGPDLPLSTAVLTSARFTYVSPVGTVERRDQPGQRLRLVDGGYFENSGAVATAEILDELLRVHAGRAARGAQTPRLRPVVIHISNDPETAEPEELKRQGRFLGQVWGPVEALLNTRPARGFQARADLQRRIRAGGWDHLHFRLCRQGDEPLPLGWTLSAEAQGVMQRQLGLNGDGGLITQQNLEQVQRIGEILRGGAPAVSGEGFRCPSEEVPEKAG